MTSPNHKLAELADIRPGYITREAVKHVPDGSYALLQIRDFTPDRAMADFANTTRITPEPRATVIPLRVGDVLFLAKGANNFAFAVPTLPTPALAAGYFFVLRPTPAILPEYLAWFLNHDSTRAVLTRLSTKGAHMPVIRRDVLASLDVPLPPVARQQTIADLDSLRQQEQRLLANLARQRHDLIANVCLAAARHGAPAKEPIPTITEAFPGAHS